MDVTSVLIYLVIGIASLAVYLIKHNLSYWKRQGIAHEEPHLIMGNFKGVRSKFQVGEIIANYYRKFKGTGPFAGIHALQRNGVVLLDKDLIRNVLISDFKNFADRGIYYNEKSDPLSGHLFLLDGDKWRTLRNKLSPTFSSGKMKYMYPTILQVADNFKQVLSETIEKDPIVDIRHLLGLFTTDVISSTAFGIETNSLRNPNSDFPRLGRKALEEQRHNVLVMALIDSFPKLARKLGMRTFPEDVHQFFMKTIMDTIAYRQKHNIQRNDFLNILLDLKNSEKSGLNEMSLEEMCAQVFVFFLGGFETSSTTMSLALYELAQHQDMQDRLRAEINEAFERDNTTSLTYETLHSMPYLNQVLMETLRKHPILAQLNRQALNDYVVPGHPKYVIKAGMSVWISVLGIQHDPEIYPNPEEFDPERFTPEMLKQRNSLDWLAFGDGPRNCIGERFGKMQSRLGLVTVIKNFRLTTCSKTPQTFDYEPKAMTYTPKNIIYLKLQEI